MHKSKAISISSIILLINIEQSGAVAYIILACFMLKILDVYGNKMPKTIFIEKGAEWFGTSKKRWSFYQLLYR